MSSTRENTDAADAPPDQAELERRRARVMWIVMISVTAVIAAVLIGWNIARIQRANNYAVPAAVTNDGGAHAGIAVAGDGPVKVEVYLDFACPACRQFEATTTPTLNAMIASHKITLVWHLLNGLDSRSSTTYSTRAASAAACAANSGQLKAYGDLLFANQPKPGGAGLSDDNLVDLGGSVGLDQPAFAACVRDTTYKRWVDHATASAHNIAVPTVLINGKALASPTPAHLIAAIAPNP